MGSTPTPPRAAATARQVRGRTCCHRRCLPEQSPLLRLQTHACGPWSASTAYLRESRAALDEAGVLGRCRQQKKRRYGSYLGEISPAPENIINRDFQAATPNEKWLTDITEFQIPAGKVYLSPVIDCFDGLVVSWTIGTRPDSDLVNTMLDAAIETVVTCESKPIIHSDRGAHYRWPGWLARVHDAKLIRAIKNGVVLSSEMDGHNCRTIHSDR